MLNNLITFCYFIFYDLMVNFRHETGISSINSFKEGVLKTLFLNDECIIYH
ncbi:hypothetical protein CSC17_1581 [Klebsiella oxytoca]|nr:hypothetical protein CSC17_1581 [Klebsiella oxytoca]